MNTEDTHKQEPGGEGSDGALPGRDSDISGGESHPIEEDEADDEQTVWSWTPLVAEVREAAIQTVRKVFPPRR